MPIYEYRCEECGGRTEVLVATSQANSPACARCGGEKVVRMPSRFSVRGVTTAPGSAASGGCCGGGCGCGNGT